MPPPEPSLKALQKRLMDALLGDAPEGAVPLLAGPPAEAAEGLAVYRNNVAGNFHDALESTFPAVRRLVGGDYFRQTARDYQSSHPSGCGDLTPAGARFPQFLRELHGQDRFAYLADVARLEWLIQESLLAAAREPLNLATLAAVPAAHYDALCFGLHPSLRLFDSPHPALRIWEANVGPGSDPGIDPDPVDLDSGGDDLAILNCRLELRTVRLAPGEAACLAALGSGAGFAQAIAAAERAAAPAAFDAAAALRRFVACGAIVDCH